jgi:hypothetical protein
MSGMKLATSTDFQLEDSQLHSLPIATMTVTEAVKSAVGLGDSKLARTYLPPFD